MNRAILTVAAVLTGVGCSHAPAKTEPAQTNLASVQRNEPAPSTRQAPATPSEVESVSRSEPENPAIYFDLDSALLRPEARTTLQAFGRELARDGRAVRIEGNCDERGTTEYNLALGEKRAREAKRYLEQLGVPGSHVSIVSYGSERPKDSGHDESAWAKNRRDDLRIN